MSCCTAISQGKHTASTVNSDPGWPVYGGDLSAQHYSPLKLINRSNVKSLQPAWTFHTGTFNKPGTLNHSAAFEASPVLWRRTLYFNSPFDEVFAVDAVSGRKLWGYDPGVDRNSPRSLVTSRGVALWHGQPSGQPCADRVYVATLDARLIALDATTGQICAGFGKAGAVDLSTGVHLRPGDDYAETSPITVVGNVLVVGSSIGDNRAVEEESGVVRGFDAVTGAQLWAWEPLAWAAGQKPRTGAGNAWSAISADAEHGLVYLPTGSPSPDFWGGFRKGNNQDADSIVALDVHTGKKIWAFQVVHHDLWDYDIAAEPLLFTYRPPGGGAPVPAVAVSTKTGMVFVFNRLNGNALYPIHEQAVPQTRVAGEWTSPTQPFSSLPSLIPLTLGPGDVSARTPEDAKACRDKLAALDNQGIFTPISTGDTLLYPGSLGGVNWGSAALDPDSGILYANVNRLAYITRLVPQLTVTGKIENHLRDFKQDLFPAPTSTPPPERFGAPDTGGLELSAQAGAPYRVYRAAFLSPAGFPCTGEPWGEVVALNLNTGKLLWHSALGTMEPGRQTGSPTLGGPIVTGGGLLFTASTVDPVFRAFDIADGKLVWEGALPAPAQATPMTYEIDGRQYVVIAAGGHGSVGLRQSDAVVAFALPAGTASKGRKR
jgi:quinoprotein glucose dehydrogenase